MNQQNRTRIQALCTDLRAPSWPAWNDAGTEAAILELDRRMPNDPLGVAVRALSAARNPQNRGPAAMLQEPTTEAVVRRLPEPPRRDDPACPEHGGTIRDDQQRFACCRFDHDPSGPAYLRVGTSNGPSAEARALIEASLGPRRKARDMAGSVGGDETK